ncbi:MAG: energy transducer TonB [Acidobacteriota bacterium]|nr:energy transducer TonB [Acidobacteriota bacterium]
MLAVEFSKNGKVENVLVLKSLGYGLDEKAIEASQDIKFEPAKKNGEPISVVKKVQYNFYIY